MFDWFFMSHSFVSFISDKLLEESIQFLLNKAKEGLVRAQKNPDRNVIDPFLAFISMSAFGLSPHKWSENEELRQAGKSLENALGDFHQKLLGSIDGWDSLATGGQVDIVCKSKRIIAEIKNKHNTVKASDKIVIYNKLDKLVNIKSSEYKDFMAYYVVITPLKPARFNREFVPPDSSRGDRASAKDNVREVDGNTFYELATGQKNALKEIFEAMPKVLHKLKKENFSDQYAHALTFFNKAFGE